MNEIPITPELIKILRSRINELSTEKGTTANQALIDSGAGKNFFSNLSTVKKISRGKISQLAIHFNVSPEYLLGKTNNKILKIDLSENEKRIISAYRNNPKIKKIIDAAVGLSDELTNDNTLKSAMENPIMLEQVHN